MSLRERFISRVLRCGIATGAVLATVLVVASISSLSEGPHLFLVLGSIIFAAWYGGLVAGLLSTLLATLGVGFAVMKPRQSLYVGSSEDVLRLVLFTAIASAISFLTAHTKSIQARLVEANAELRRLTARMEKVREEERAALAHDIHDEIGGVLAVLKIDTSFVQQRTRHDAIVQERIKIILKQIDTAIETLQRLATELRPSLLDHVGLTAAIEAYLRDMCRRTGLQCEEHIDADIGVHDDCAVALFRAFQEALMNVIRHADATKVTVSLTKTSTDLTLSVADNGVGVQEEQIRQSSGIGVLGMKERVRPFDGTVTISGVAGVGTTVTIVVPARYCNL